MKHDKYVSFEIRTLTNLLRRHVDASSTKKYIDNLTGMHGWVIGYLYDRRDKDVFQRDLEEEFTVRRSTATAILQLMEKNELVTRQPVSYDARLKKLELTPKALELHRMIAKDIEQMEKLLTKGISEQELAAFFVTIGKLKRNIE